ncbi:hypothetical protein AURDEDRAFT_117323 [Auricularia subglabra TFB-10046 SS5]|nr:hypothetical protein AURDEDRAFT_117323 [Auricularia subglabra TFB-10046 SS5]
MFALPLHPRRSPSWEVVTSQSVRASQSPFETSEHTAPEHTRAYTFDLPAGPRVATADVRRAVQRARELFVLELPQSSHRRLLDERWKLTILRKGQQNRVEVTYIAALGSRDSESHAHAHGEPPFLEIIDSRVW